MGNLPLHLTVFFNYLKYSFIVFESLASLVLVVFKLHRFRTLKPSLDVFQNLKPTCSSVCIVSGGGGGTFPSCEFDAMSTGSAACDRLAGVGFSKYLLHYQAPIHEPISREKYYASLERIATKYSPSLIISSPALPGHTIEVSEVLTPGALLTNWPFLKGVTGVTSLVWLAYRLGYQNIYLVGFSGTRICDQKVVDRHRAKRPLETKVTDVHFFSYWALIQFERVCDYIRARSSTKIIQTEIDSWAQPCDGDRWMEDP